MLRSKPILSYCGLTVILSNPSRFDTARLLTGQAMHVLSDYCLRPDLNIMQCDVRVADDKSPFLPNTKCLLLLGEYAMHYHIPQTRKNTLNEMRGSLFYYNDIPAIASYFPQDCCELKNYEKEHNTEHKSIEEVDEANDEKRQGNTDRANFSFWLKMDCKKVKHLLQHGKPKEEPQPTYITFPTADEVINVLSTTTDKFLYFDMETDREEANWQCFSFTFDGRIIYNIPVLDYRYKPAYSTLGHIIRALVLAIKRNTIVAHNGACFDFLVLGYKYHIPVYRVYDTLVAMHRCFPSVEKSLAHCTSLWTWQQFHKDENSHSYCTHEQMMDRMRYCGKDVFTMYLIHQAIAEYAKSKIGLQDSIDTAMASIIPYLTMSLQGIRYDEELRAKLAAENDRLMEQYLRWINILIGEEGMKQVKSVIKTKAGSMPNSNPQCVQYFHNMLGYPVVAKSKPNKLGIRNPSLAKDAMFKLRLQHDNPVIDICNLFRSCKLETTVPLGFMPWKTDDNKIYEQNNH